MIAPRPSLFNLGRPAAERIGRCDPAETILIAGTPRGGTTLVLEALMHLDGRKAVNEPEMLKYAARHGFSYRTFMAPGARHAGRERYLSRVLSGHLDAPGPWQLRSRTAAGQLAEIARRRKLVVKFCRANRMLQWLSGRFELRGTILVVRHPCAVVASMLQHGAWQAAMTSLEPGHALDLSALPVELQDRFRPLVADVATPLDALAVTWCLDTCIPLLYHDHHPWAILPYERLIRQKEAELRRICDALGVDCPPRVAAVLDRPSSSTKTDLGADADAQLGKWRTTLSADDARRILKFVRRAGLAHIYDEATDPDYAVLDRYAAHPPALMSKR